MYQRQRFGVSDGDFADIYGEATLFGLRQPMKKAPAAGSIIPDLRKLLHFNVGLALVHAASFVAQAAIVLARDAKPFRAVMFIEELNVDSALAQETSGTDTLSFLSPSLSLVGKSYSLVWLAVSFSALTSASHAFQAWLIHRGDRDYIYGLFRCTNGWRWAEYSVTAGIMTWVMAQACLATHPFVLAALAVSNLIMQGVGGYLAEKLANKRATGFLRQKLTFWVAFLTGWLVFGYTASVVLYYFSVNGASAPDFVTYIVRGNMVFYAVFGVVFCYGLFCERGSVSPPTGAFPHSGWNKWANWFNYEACYGVMSLLAKLWLSWNVLLGAVRL